MRRNPSRCASLTRWLMRVTERISPLSPTSPAMQVPGFTGWSYVLDSTLTITLRSMAGSLTLMPPAMLRNTSFCASLNPARFSRTANSMFSLRMSKPVADRCALP